MQIKYPEGARVRAARQAKGYSLRWLADKLGMASQSGVFIGRIEAGTYRPSLELKLKLAKLLEIPVRRLADKEELALLRGANLL